MVHEYPESSGGNGMFKARKTGLPPFSGRYSAGPSLLTWPKYWNWPFSAGSMPRFPSSARAENGCNRRAWLIREGSYRSGTHNSKPRFGRGSRRQPRAPGRRIPRQAAGDIGPNRRGRLGPTDPQWPLPYPAGLWPRLTRALISPRWCACAVRYARVVLVAPSLEGPPTHWRLAT